MYQHHWPPFPLPLVASLMILLSFGFLICYGDYANASTGFSWSLSGDAPRDTLLDRCLDLALTCIPQESNNKREDLTGPYGILRIQLLASNNVAPLTQMASDYEKLPQGLHVPCFDTCSQEFREDVARFKSFQAVTLRIAEECFGFLVYQKTESEVISTGDTLRWLQEPMAGDDYEIGIRMRHETYDGVTLIAAKGYSLGKQRLAAGCALSFLNGREFSDSVITGIGSLADEGQRSLVGTLYEREWNRSKANGGAYGYMLDMAGAVSVTDNTVLGIQISNLLGFMKWKGATYTEGVINTNTVVVDEHGYITYAPSVSGRETSGDVLDIPGKILRIAFSRVKSSSEAGIALTFDELGISPSSWLRMKSMGQDSIEIGCGRALSGRLSFRIGVIHQGWHISIMSDSLEPSQARTLGGGLECKLEF